MSDNWPGMVAHIDRWLDANPSGAYLTQSFAQDWARIAKVSEELGETVAAYIGATGQNPRKGYSHDMIEVLNELADVTFTAILAIQHFTKSEDATFEILSRRISHLYRRVVALSVPNGG